ncbi:hypothetical protein ElyMa_004772800 [Elysia marginata]|uniref:ABC transmembrane type-1 domain-containing protein n=1 Tax=Elysia marginata TaxID=1093978 RepID=A0AAV4IHR6_9GAST|nr:hypothetical protein ElyMa_004772800 [Elysia marginata]
MVYAHEAIVFAVSALNPPVQAPLPKLTPFPQAEGLNDFTVLELRPEMTWISTGQSWFKNCAVVVVVVVAVIAVVEVVVVVVVVVVAAVVVLVIAAVVVAVVVILVVVVVVVVVVAHVVKLIEVSLFIFITYIIITT